MRPGGPILSGMRYPLSVRKPKSCRKLQNELESIYMNRLSWIKQLKSDPLHKKIMLIAAVDKRKFLIKILLKDYTFTEDSDNEDH
jgi:hypothetical protein